MSKITVFNKIGFHAGPGGNPTGIGDYMSKLDAAGIPFVMKSVDHYGFLFEAAQFTNAAHVLCYRLSAFGQPGDYNFDVPDYAIDPDEAAAKHWKHMRDHLPPEFNRERVWIEPINEIDKGRSDWLGHFSAEFGEIALREGLKVMQFAWSSGEPEQDHWELPGMLRYLQMCADHPDQLGIALHEYSYDKNDIFRLNGELVGRFRRLFEVCDKHGLRRPKIIMTEWGWTHNRVPDPSNALIDIEEVNKLYAKYPEILGAAIWYLGPGFGNIANQAQRLIQPVTNFSLNWRIEVEPELPAPPTPAVPGGGPETVSLRTQPMTRPITILEPERPQPTKPSNATYVADISIPDDTEIGAGSSFNKTWRVKNSGQTSWDERYKLVFIGGDPMGDVMAVDVPAAEPGQTVDLTIPLRAPLQKEGTVFGDWRMLAPEGHQFGDVLYLRITVAPPLPTDGINNAAFITDVTIPDDTVLDSGATFTKTWRIKNTGSKAWGSGYTLTFVGGVNMSGPQSLPLPAIQPGQTIEVSVPMKAPIVPGVHWADWRPKDPRGDFFGDIVYTRIVVPEPAGTGGRITPLSQNDPRWKELRLGDSLSDLTIGEWGCLITCFAMISNGFGKDLTPADLNERLLRKQLFLDHKLTPWNTLSKLYSDIIYEGRLEARNTPNLTERIDTALRAGNPIAVQVDYTPESTYTPNDQHWVVVVGREGNDYRINDPWIYPSVETSMRMRYGRPGKLLRDSIISAVFYRTTRPQPPLPVIGSGVLSATEAPPRIGELLQSGINLDPVIPNCNPHNEQELKGLDWVRFTYKIAAHPDPKQRNMRAAFANFDETIRDYQRMGIGTIIVLNQETVWGNAPWSGDGDWPTYSAQLAQVAGQIARHYARYDDRIAFEVWQKQDLPQDPAAVYVPPDSYARLLKEVSAAVRQAAPRAKILVGGLVTHEDTAIAYLEQVAEKLSGELPVDAIGVQPYGRWGARAPFDWGQTSTPISGLIKKYKTNFPTLPLWVTEIGVASSEPIGEALAGEIADYMTDLFEHINERSTADVPVMIWYAWSDLMSHAGVVDANGRPKARIYEAFRKVRNKEV